MAGEPTRQIYWNIEHEWLMYALFGVVLIILVYRLNLFRKCWRKGKPLNRIDRLRERILAASRNIFLHQRLFTDKLSGVSHYALFLGFLLLTAGTAVVGLQADLGLPVMKGNLYLVFQSLVLDLAGAAAVIGLVFLLVKRYVLRPARLDRTLQDWLVPAWIIAILLSGFVLEGLRIFATLDPWAGWSPVGLMFSQAIPAFGFSKEQALVVHRSLWWGHLLISFGLIAYIPFSKLLHVIMAPVALVAADLAPPGKLNNVDLEGERLGLNAITDLTWKELMELDVCVECGRCQEGCPAYLTQKDYSPKRLIQGFKKISRALAHKQAAAGLQEELNHLDIWSCTTCLYCSANCPILIEHLPKVLEIRRHLSMELAEMPEQMGEALKSLEKRFHPYRGASMSREEWAKDVLVSPLSEAKYVFWVGCTASLDKRASQAVKAFAQLLNKAGIPFGLLGAKEKCCGDPARRMGNDYLYQVIAKQNIAQLKKLQDKQIVTTCPHCFNVLKNEYATLGLELEVYHHSQLLNSLIEQGVLKFNFQQGLRVSYHDPCYLGRYNQLYGAPREAISSIDGLHLVEMPRNRRQSICCGGGGGRMWVDEKPEQRASVLRAKEFIGTGSESLVTSCPYCLLMMDDAVRNAGDTAKHHVLDIAELLWQRVI